MYVIAPITRLVLASATCLVIGFGFVPTATASAAASSYDYPASGGIQITRVAQPTCERPRGRVYGFATKGVRTASLTVRRSTTQNKWSREDTSQMLSTGETFRLVSEPFKRGARKLTLVSSMPKGGYFDSEVSSMTFARPSRATCGLT